VDPAAQANAITHLGQPALLYVVPLTLGSVAATAAARGDITRVLQYNDAPAAVQTEPEAMDAET